MQVSWQKFSRLALDILAQASYHLYEVKQSLEDMRGKKDPPIPRHLSLNGKNREQLEKIGLFAELSEGFSPGFTTMDYPRSSEQLVQCMQDQGIAPTVYWIGIELADPDIDSLEEIITFTVDAISIPPGAKPALIVSGLEYSVGIEGDGSPLLGRMNFYRDSYKEVWPYPILFLLPEYALERIRKYAPHFYGWGALSCHLWVDLPKSCISTTGLPGLSLEEAGLSASMADLELLDQRLSNEPGPSVAQGDLLLLRGQAHFSRSEYGAAYRNFADAYEVYESLESVVRRTDPNLSRFLKGREARALCHLAKLFDIKGYPSRGLHHSGLALAYYKEIGDKRGVCTALGISGSLYLELGEYGKSERLHRRALEIRQAELGEDGPSLARPLALLADCLRQQEKLDEAEEMQSRALRTLYAAANQGDGELAENRLLLSIIQRDRGDCESAEAGFLKAMALYEKEFGPNHPSVANCLMELGELYKSEEKSAELKAVLLRALAIVDEALGEGSDPAAALRLKLALQYQMEGCHAELAEFIRGALPALDEVLGTDNADIKRLREILADCEAISHPEILEKRDPEIRYHQFFAYLFAAIFGITYWGLGVTALLLLEIESPPLRILAVCAGSLAGLPLGDFILRWILASLDEPWDD